MPITIEIGQRCEPLDDLLRKLGLDSWAFVTVWNMLSKVLSEEENHKRHDLLLKEISPFLYWEGEGVGADPAWEPERSVLILGIGREEAISLGKQFNQHAIVVGNLGEEAALLWTNPGLEARTK